MRRPIDPIWEVWSDDLHEDGGPAIDIWRTHASQSPAHTAWSELWGEEPTFASDAVRTVKVSSRQLLFSVLSRYLKAPAETIRITRDVRGRPKVPGVALDFNLSHSGDWVVLAVARGGRVGIDIEQVRMDRDVCGIARRYFAASEASEVCKSEGERGMGFFYQLWTAKEAALKAQGGGIAHGLADTCFHGDHEIRLGDGSLWTWCPFHVEPGYAGAVVWRPASDIRLRFFQFDGE